MPPDPITLTIDAVVHGGAGFGRVDGQACFVAGALPGERVRAVPVSQTAGFLRARLLEVLDPSPDRLLAPEAQAQASGGGTWLHFAYPAQATWKRHILVESLARLGGIDADPAWREAPEWRTGYRTRAQYQGNNGRWGFYAPGTHHIVDMAECPLCHPKLNAAFAELRTIRGRTTVELVANPEGEDVLAWSRRPHPGLGRLFPRYDTSANRGPRHGFLFDGVPVVNGCFSQSSLLLNRLLRATVQEFSGTPASLLDLYCGTGNVSLLFRDTAEVLGLDASAAAVRAANAQAPGRYRAAPETEFAREFAARPWDLIVLDPPRAGAKAVMPALAACEAAAIVYVSCDPATLARDLKALGAAGWAIDRIAALDLFPYTPHIETVCRLVRR